MQLIPATRWKRLTTGMFLLMMQTVSIFVIFLTDHYEVHPGNSYMTLTLREKATGKVCCELVQSHVPGGPLNSAPARQEFTHAILRDFESQAVTLVMGDMNRSPDYFLDDFDRSAAQLGMDKQPFI